MPTGGDASGRRHHRGRHCTSRSLVRTHGRTRTHKRTRTRHTTRLRCASARARLASAPPGARGGARTQQAKRTTSHRYLLKVPKQRAPCDLLPVSSGTRDGCAGTPRCRADLECRHVLYCMHTKRIRSNARSPDPPSLHRSRRRRTRSLVASVVVPVGHRRVAQHGWRQRRWRSRRPQCHERARSRTRIVHRQLRERLG